ncbi:endonuclease III, partial [Enterococcus faecium]
HCTARNHKCEVCPLLSICQDGKKRMRLKEKALKKKPRL